MAASGPETLLALSSLHVLRVSTRGTFRHAAHTEHTQHAAHGRGGGGEKLRADHHQRLRTVQVLQRALIERSEMISCGVWAGAVTPLHHTSHLLSIFL